MAMSRVLCIMLVAVMVTCATCKKGNGPKQVPNRWKDSSNPDKLEKFVERTRAEIMSGLDQVVKKLLQAEALVSVVRSKQGMDEMDEDEGTRYPDARSLIDGFKKVEYPDANTLTTFVEGILASTVSICNSMNNVLNYNDPNKIPLTDFERAADMPYDTDIGEGEQAAMESYEAQITRKLNQGEKRLLDTVPPVRILNQALRQYSSAFPDAAEIKSPVHERLASIVSISNRIKENFEDAEDMEFDIDIGSPPEDDKTGSSRTKSTP